MGNGEHIFLAQKFRHTDILSSGVLALKPYVSEEDLRRLMDFVYIDSAEKLAEFDQFVRSLGVKEVEGEVSLGPDRWMLKVLSRLVGPQGNECMDLAMLD
jgi:hypothetical protein